MAKVRRDEPEWQHVYARELYDHPDRRHGFNVTIFYVGGNVERPVIQLYGDGDHPWLVSQVNASGDNELHPDPLSLDDDMLRNCGRSTRGPHNVVREMLRYDSMVQRATDPEWFDNSHVGSHFGRHR